MLEIRRLDGADDARYIPALAAVLVDCVEGNASVSFMLPLPRETAEAFFAAAFAEVAMGTRVVLAAFLGEELVGTVQLVHAPSPNQPHRADVAKLLVSRAARGRGVAKQLMLGLEAEARREGKTLLVLDTVAGGTAEGLYSRMGWVRVGTIPNYALYPDGRLCDTVVFWKQIEPLGTPE